MFQLLIIFVGGYLFFNILSKLHDEIKSLKERVDFLETERNK